MIGQIILGVIMAHIIELAIIGTASFIIGFFS